MLVRGLAVAILCLAFAAPASATSVAAAPCWKRLTLDWAADGRVDGTYPRACYQQAIENMEPDLEFYSSFPDDIRRALQRASSGGGTTTGDNPTLTSASGETDDGSSVPLPLILLGGAAVLLVAAGVGGMLWRRVRNRPAGP